MTMHDLAIRWNDKPGGLNRIRRLGGVTYYGHPRHLKVPGAKVYIVTNGGAVSLVFRVAGVVGPRVVELADGKKRKGYLLKAKHGSIHRPAGREPKRLPIGWYVIGGIRYLDARTARPVLVSRNDFGDREYIDEDKVPHQGVTFRSFNGTIPGRLPSHPEAQLVARYVEWLNDSEGFGHNYIRQAGLFVDLFDRRKWRLIEAKAQVDRERLRTAVGQLLDYRRFYRKHPSLAVLVPSKPSDAILDYLKAIHITAIWETAHGRFHDSTEAQSWTDRRRR